MYLWFSTATDRMAAENGGDDSDDALRYRDGYHQTSHGHLMAVRGINKLFILILEVRADQVQVH